MKKYLSIILCIVLCLSSLVACEMGFGGSSSSDKESSKDKAQNSAVKAYVYDYKDISELENADSPAELDEKKWQSASNFDLAKQWVIFPTDNSADFGANVCKLENTSSNAMKVDLSFKIKGDIGSLGQFIKLGFHLMNGNGDLAAAPQTVNLSALQGGTVFISGTIPAGETYYLTVMQETTFSNIVVKPEFDYSEKVTAEYDHNHYETSFEDYSYDGAFEGDYEEETKIYYAGSYKDYTGEYTYTVDPSFKVEYVTGFGYEEYTYIYGTPSFGYNGDFSYVIGTGDGDYTIVFGTADMDSIIVEKYPVGNGGSISGTTNVMSFDAKVYLNCKATKTKVENDQFGDSFDTSWGGEMTATIETNNGYTDDIYDFNNVNYQKCNETMYIHAPDGHQVVAFDKRGNTVAIAHGAEVTRIGYGGYWSKIDLYGEIRYIQTEYLDYGMPSYDTEMPPEVIQAPVEYKFDDRYEKVYIYDRINAVILYDEYFNEVGNLIHGQECILTGISMDRDGIWTRIEYNGFVAYVFSKYISYNEGGFYEYYTTVYPAYDLPIYDKASENSTVTGTAYEHKPVQVIAENADRGWYFIEFYDDYGSYKTGYIMSFHEFFTTSDNVGTDVEVPPEEIEYDRPWERGEVPYPYQTDYVEYNEYRYVRSEYATVPLYDENGDQVFTLSTKDEVYVISKDVNGFWYYVDYQNKFGYIPVYYID